MTIVRLGSPILQVPQEKDRCRYVEKLLMQIENLFLYITEQCITAAMETEVTRALGRGVYQRCEHDANVASASA